MTILRKAWILKKEDMRLNQAPQNDFDLFSAITRMRRAFHLPRRGFFKGIGPSVDKPIFIDFENFFLVEVFYKKLLQWN